MPEGDRRITLMELSIKMSKTAPAKSCMPTFQTDWKKCCTGNIDLKSPPLLYSSYYYCDQHTFFSFMPSVLWPGIYKA